MAEVSGTYFFARIVMEIPGTSDDSLVLVDVVVRVLSCRKSVAVRCPYSPLSPTAIAELEDTVNGPLIYIG
jgi:hypothetical protein